jgi:opacity protein-like surface antigen
MKRLITIVAAMAFVGVNAVAADTATAPAMHFGVHAGVNFANVTASTAGVSASADTMMGIQAGALAEFPLTDMFALQPELNFIQKGSKTGDVSTKLNYIEVPVWAKAKFNVGGVKPFLMLGPSIGFLMSAKTGDTDIKNNLKTIDFGLNFGGGAAFAVTDTMDLFLDLRYNLGLANILKTDGLPAGTDVSMKNHGFQITAGLMF